MANQAKLELLAIRRVDFDCLVVTLIRIYIQKAREIGPLILNRTPQSLIHLTYDPILMI